VIQKTNHADSALFSHVGRKTIAPLRRTGKKPGRQLYPKDDRGAHPRAIQIGAKAATKTRWCRPIWNRLRVVGKLARALHQKWCNAIINRRGWQAAVRDKKVETNVAAAGKSDFAPKTLEGKGQNGHASIVVTGGKPVGILVAGPKRNGARKCRAFWRSAWDKRARGKSETAGTESWDRLD